ncbi:MAG: nucleotidyltransferase [Clostridia bacterium]|nr:nucleotidyltransferase [Clostridia bacterium]
MNRINDINNLLSKLDITPTMYMNAIEKYKHLGDFLTSKGFEIDFYPQGSIALGTVVRPYKNNEDTSYDLDAICQLQVSKQDTTPKAIKEAIEKAFQEDERYKYKLKIYDECCAIEYADVNGIGFSIDIVSAVDEDILNKQKLASLATYPEYIDTSIAIPSHESQEYRWITNNPRGYKAWFDGINNKFLSSNPIYSKEAIFNENRSLFSSIEEIPENLQKTSLQRVIQLLKRHRDVYFSKSKNGNDIKPISAIITTLVTAISESTHVAKNTIELLEYVLGELNIYSERQILNEKQFFSKYETRDIIQRIDGKWEIKNPVNPNDNLADAWNYDERLPKAFFAWCQLVRDDFNNIINNENKSFVNKLENSFGSNFVKSNFAVDKYLDVELQNNISNIRQVKPWRKV